MKIDKAFCDLGASVSLIPLSICQKLEVGELKPTTISLQLAGRFVKYPVGILENIPIKVGKFFIPVDFVVLEMEEDIQIPIILGRPFLATAGAIIDVKMGVDKLVKEEFHKAHPEDPLEACIVHSHTADNENTEIAACAQSLETNHCTISSSFQSGGAKGGASQKQTKRQH
ncbi:uncharacterized protein LOC131171198 [Hevea brasiliensis]|uniref:uncharacterized protein LOC131171198 n=1 Tax=Hevea brasiliensis TaxID=3981 RepID=UPI0025D52064|nr:uncharacterized protein LOC131171198 [Hevea brasiliensis]